MNKAIISGFIVILSACSTITDSGLHRGENLLQPLPIPGDDWQVRSGRKGDTEVIVWVKDMHSATTKVLHRSGGSPASEFRKISDEAVRESCVNFEVKDYNAFPVNGFDRQLWLVDCEFDSGKKIKVLHLYISGNDSGYYLSRKWHVDPSQADVDVWVDYYRSVSLCDTRENRSAQCPEVSRVDRQLTKPSI